MDDPNKKPQILIIDDEKDFVEVVKILLEQHGYNVTAAVDSEEGLALAKSNIFDLIICDLKMPNKDGYKVLEEFRRSQREWTPFIILSALTEFDKIRKAYISDSDLYLTKPIKLNVLVKNIRTLLNLKKTKD